MAKEEYFWDFYKDSTGKREVKVEAMWDKNGKELYNGAKAKYIWDDGTEEVGKILISQYISDVYPFKRTYSYGFKPKKGSQLFIFSPDNIELL